MYRTTRRLCLTRDGSRVVPEGHPEGWTLFAVAGAWLPEATAIRYRLAEVEALTAAPETEAIPGPPETAALAGPPATYAVARAARKAR